MAKTTLSPEQARQGRIALTTRTRRAVFLAGLIGFAVLAAVATLV